MSKIKVGLLLQGRVVGADDGGDGFDVEEEVLVECPHRGKWSSKPSRRLSMNIALAGCVKGEAS